MRRATLITTQTVLVAEIHGEAEHAVVNFTGVEFQEY